MRIVAELIGALVLLSVVYIGVVRIVTFINSKGESTK